MSRETFIVCGTEEINFGMLLPGTLFLKLLLAKRSVSMFEKLSLGYSDWLEGPSIPMQSIREEGDGSCGEGKGKELKINFRSGDHPVTH